MNQFEARLSEMKADAEICNERMRARIGQFANFGKAADQNNERARVARERQAKVRDMALQGINNNTIAALLNVSHNTVKSDRSILRQRGELE